MNLYEIMLEHYSPKDSEKGIFTYLVAQSDEEVYEWLKANPKLKDGRWLLTTFEDYERDEKTYEIYDDDYEVIGEESFKEKMIRLKGTINDEDQSFDDLYYGLTLYGWELVKEDITEEQLKVLEETNISLERFK
ncbi:hypothetical protein ACU3L3_07090 [Priestia endophytica]